MPEQFLKRCFQCTKEKQVAQPLSLPPLLESITSAQALNHGLIGMAITGGVDSMRPENDDSIAYHCLKDIEQQGIFLFPAPDMNF